MAQLNAVWIDSEASFIDSMRLQLDEGYNIVHYADFDEGHVNSIVWTEVDLVLMEIKLRDQIALPFVTSIRGKKQNLPIVIVTQHACKDTCIAALNLGVNALIEKPVHVQSLKEILERHRFKGFELKMSHDRKAVFSQANWVDLTSTEYKILETLKTARRRLTRAELQSAVWPNSSISENNLDTHLTNLKRKIPELNQCLNVKRGLGYYLEVRS
jgi:DNA-binding response OmpR family regulator